MNNTDTIEILQAMKEALMERGWCQGDFARKDGAVCLMGSLTRTGIYERFGMHLTFADRRVELVMDALRREGGMSPIGWNDKRGRTFNEVIDLIDNAIISEKMRSG